MHVGLFNAATWPTIPVGTDMVETSGYHTKGLG
jgi:hypothetical protein